MTLYLNPTDREILRELAEGGPNSPSGLAEALERDSKNVSGRLKRLRDEADEPGVRRRTRGVYVITDHGRELLAEYIDEPVIDLELRREGLITDGNLTERGREWHNRLTELL